MTDDLHTTLTDLQESLANLAFATEAIVQLPEASETMLASLKAGLLRLRTRIDAVLPQLP